MKNLRLALALALALAPGPAGAQFAPLDARPHAGNRGVNLLRVYQGVILYNLAGQAAVLGVNAAGKVVAETAITPAQCPAGTSSAIGCVQPDGTIITVSAGAITVAKATSAAFGVIEGDGVTLSLTSGVLAVNLGNANTWTATQTFPNTSITNAELANSAMTFGGQNVSLGGSAVVQGSGVKIQLASGTYTSGHCIQYNSNGSATDSGAACGVPVLGAVTVTTVASPAGPNSTSAFTMQGLAASITPVTTGRLVITITGSIQTSVTSNGDGVTYQISYGTGSAPTTNGALTGTQLGLAQTLEVASGVTTAANLSDPFSVTYEVSGLTLGTAVWIDLAAKAIGATGYSLNNVNMTIHEI